MSDVDALPSGWVELPFSEVIQTQKGKKPFDLGEKSNERVVPYINIKAFEKKIIFEYAPEQDVVSCTSKDVLLVWDGARAGLSGRGVSGYVGSTLARVRSDLVIDDYLYYFMGSIYGLLNTQTKGVGIPHINPVVLHNIPFLLPPKNEQTRIVEKLEELLSDLDNGIAELKAAQIKLGQYRQSLLKSAVEGSLTAEWRDAQGRANVAGGRTPGATKNNTVTETGEQLLQRILKERRERWEQEKLAEFKVKNKKPPKDWQKKYPEPVQPDTSDLPELPEGWVWGSVAQLASDERYSLAIGPFGSNLKVSDYRDSGVPLVFVRNIRSGNYGGEFTKFVSEEKANELVAHSVSADDVIVTKMGEPPGDADVFPSDQPNSIITADCIKIRCCEGLVFPEYLKAVINSWLGKKQIVPMTKGVAQKKVSLGRFSSLAIPLPSIDEQSLIVKEVLKSQELNDRELDSIVDGLKQSDAQRKNILKDAFSGKLVEQDVNDEPASVLLDKIKAERAEKEKQPKSKKVKKKDTSMNKLEVNAVKEWVSRQSEQFTFEELQAEFKGEYDILKEIVFELLQEKKAVVNQVFNEERKYMVFEKAAR